MLSRSHLQMQVISGFFSEKSKTTRKETNMLYSRAVPFWSGTLEIEPRHTATCLYTQSATAVGISILEKKKKKKKTVLCHSKRIVADIPLAFPLYKTVIFFNLKTECNATNDTLSCFLFTLIFFKTCVFHLKYADDDNQRIKTKNKQAMTQHKADALLSPGKHISFNLAVRFLKASSHTT